MTTQTAEDRTTYLVRLWLDNDEGSYFFWRERAQEVFADCQESHESWNTPSEQARYRLADEIAREHTEGYANPIAGDATVFADLLGYALACVDWNEVADSRLEEIDGYETR